MRFHLVGIDGAPGDENVYDGWDSRLRHARRAARRAERALMGRLIVEQIVSVDGYAADPEGGIDFFEAVDEVDLERRRPARVPRARRRDPARRQHLPDVRRLLAAGRPRGRARRRAHQPPAEVRGVEHADGCPVGRRSRRDPPRRRGRGGRRAEGALRRHRRVGKPHARRCAASRPASSTSCACASCPCSSARVGRSRPPTLGERRLELDHVVAHPSGHVGMTYAVR